MTSISEIDSKNLENSNSEYEDNMDGDEPITDEINLDNNNLIKINNNIFTDELKKEDKIIRPDNERISRNKLTKYERVRVIGERTNLLARGAKPMIFNVDNLTSKQIAEEEFKQKVIPFILERPIPDGTFERWKLSEMNY